MEASAAALWINSAFSVFDLLITTYIHQLYLLAGDFFTPFFKFISFLGKDGIVLIILSLALMIPQKTRKYGTAMLFSVAIGALITNCCLKILIARPRPYSYDGSTYQEYWKLVGMCMESDKSFPSGHTTAAFATMTSLFLTGNKKYSWMAYIFAVLMGIARIYLVVHYPTDVLAGIVVGVLAGIIGTMLALRLPKKYYTLSAKKT